MYSPVPYDIVLSLAGHDSGTFYLVTGITEGERLLLCNGKNRGLQDPKCKSPKHVRIVTRNSDAPVTDKEIRETLALAAEKAAPKEGTDLV